MNRLATKFLVAASVMTVVFSLGASKAEAFWGWRRPVTTAYAMPSVPVTAAYAPVVVARPVVVASPVITAAPVTTYYAPATTTYAPATTTYYPPAPVTTTYYAPAPVTSYVAPTTTYYAPAAGVVVQRPVIVWP